MVWNVPKQVKILIIKGHRISSLAVQPQHMAMDW